MARLPDARGHFGRFGGRFVPEVLMAPLLELEAAYWELLQNGLGTIAACEVVVGLGIIVALYRRRLPIDVDQLRRLHG